VTSIYGCRNQSAATSSRPVKSRGNAPPLAMFRAAVAVSPAHSAGTQASPGD